MKKYSYLLWTLAIGIGALTANAQSLEMQTLTETEITQLQAPEKAIIELPDKPIAKTTAEYDNSHVPNSVTIDKSKAVGEIPFTSGVSASGAMTYNVPVEVYPGIHGMQPQLALAYNHLSGNGIVGVGWNIAGLSSISRTAKNLYYDGLTQGIRMDKNDAFVLDGMRLIKLSETSTQIKYESEQGNIKVNAAISGTIVKYFEVLYPNGNKGTYGYTTNTTYKLSYPLTSMTDLWGNTMTYEYTFSNNHYKIDKISYANASVEFQYNSRPDVISTYEAGSNIVENQRLGSIVCKLGSNTLRTYNLTYQTQQGLSVLSEIGYTAAGSSLNPLKFYYGTGNTASAYTKTETQLTSWYNFHDIPEQLRVAKGKFDYGTDDDGIITWPNKDPYYSKFSVLDLNKGFQNQYELSDKIFLYTGLTNPYPYPVEIMPEANFIDIFCANIDGKQEEEVIKVNNGISGSYDQVNFKVYGGSIYTGIAYKYTRTFNFSTIITAGTSKSIHPKFYYTGDFNGDGKMEVLAVSCHTPWGKTDIKSKCYLFDLENGTKLYEGETIPFFVDFPRNSSMNPETSDRLFVVDYDGDGKSDICHINDDGVHIYRFVVSGSTYNLTRVATYTGLKKTDLKSRTLLPGELNGDGKVDLLLSPLSTNPYDHTWSIFYSMGNGQFSKTTCQSTNSSSGAKFFLQDVNGDGLTDLIDYNNVHFLTYLATNGIILGSYESYSRISNSILIPNNILSGNYYSQLVSLRNDGIVEKYAFPRNDTGERLLTGVASSFGVVNKHYYSMLCKTSGNYSKAYGAVYPYENFQGPLYVPTYIEQYFNGQVNDYQSYRYSNAVIHKQGLGFRGFETITSYDKRGTPNIQTFDPYNFGVLKSQESPVAKNTYTSTVDVAPNKIVTIRITGTSVQDKLKNQTINSSYEYDTYGNPTKETINYGDGITETIDKIYYNNTNESGYLLGFVRDATKTTNRNDSTFVERNYIARYTKGMPQIKTQYINGNQVTQETFAYNTTGNLIGHGIRNYSSPTILTTSYEYDSYGRLEKETDPLGLFVSYEYYPSTGLLYKKKNHKQHLTQYSYDALGRVTTLNYPDGTSESSAWAWTSTSGLYRVAHTATGQPLTKTYYDALGRETRSSSTQFNGAIAATDKVYDTYGRLQKVSLPFTGSSATLWNTCAYDSYDRLTSLSYASGKRDSYSYSGKNITTTKEGIASTQYFDAQGNLISVTDPAGTITYNLHPDGQPASIVAPGNITTSFEYDKYRRKTAIVDPSAGRKSFAYDAAGNIQTETNANGDAIRYGYDTYNRLIQKEIAGEPTVTYKYNADGLLMAERGGNVTRNYTYDVLLRLKTEEESSECYLQKIYTYDKGNLFSKTYVSSTETIATENYIYANGYLVELRLGSTPIWKLDAVNNLGQPTGVTTGPFTRTYGYKAYGVPTSRKAGSFMNFEYTFSITGENLTSRFDAIRRIGESFGYDNLNRLTSNNATTIGYDNKGNISQKTNIGTDFVYNSGKPYALSGLTTTSNAIPQRNQNITYTSFDRPAAISENNCTASFTYDGNGGRVKMLLEESKNINVSTTEYRRLERDYLANCYEKDRQYIERIKVSGKTIVDYYQEENTKEKLYLGGDYYSAPAVYVKETGGNWNIYYICRDYLGSITHITDSSGSLVQELSYDAWGRLRNLANLQAYAPGSEPELFLGRGYTGHEHLPEFGLINMNARLYDPAVGRFLSPDPHVQNPLLSQNFNRYSYVLNNPLKYVDKSGKDYWSTNDPEEMENFVEHLRSHQNNGGSGWDSYDYSSWNHMSDSEFLAGYNNFSGTYTFNDATQSVFTSYATVFEGAWIVNGVFINVNDQSAYDYIKYLNQTYFGLTSQSGYNTGGILGDGIDGLGVGMQRIDGTFRIMNGSTLSPKYYSSGWNGGSRARITTYNISKWGSRISKNATGVNVAVGIYQIGEGMYEDNWTYGYNAQHATATTAGGMLGGWAGAEAGAAIGAWFCGWGAIPGAIIGGILGTWGGSETGGAIHDDFYY